MVASSAGLGMHMRIHTTAKTHATPSTTHLRLLGAQAQDGGQLSGIGVQLRRELVVARQLLLQVQPEHVLWSWRWWSGCVVLPNVLCSMCIDSVHLR